MQPSLTAIMMYAVVMCAKQPFKIQLFEILGHRPH